MRPSGPSGSGKGSLREKGFRRTAAVQVALATAVCFTVAHIATCSETVAADDVSGTASSVLEWCSLSLMIGMGKGPIASAVVGALAVPTVLMAGAGTELVVSAMVTTGTSLTASAWPGDGEEAAGRSRVAGAGFSSDRSFVCIAKNWCIWIPCVTCAYPHVSSFYLVLEKLTYTFCPFGSNSTPLLIGVVALVASIFRFVNCLPLLSLLLSSDLQFGTAVAW